MASKGLLDVCGEPIRHWGGVARAGAALAFPEVPAAQLLPAERGQVAAISRLAGKALAIELHHVRGTGHPLPVPDIPLHDAIINIRSIDTSKHCLFVYLLI